MAEAVVVDASALLDVLLDTQLGGAVARRLRGHEVHVPAHFDAEILSALGRLHRAGDLEADAVEDRLREVESAPIQRHPLAGLLSGAWSRRHNLRLVDALYVELAEHLGHIDLVTTDGGLAASTELAELITLPHKPQPAP